jgi:AraC-like DNA-binding protein
LLTRFPFDLVSNDLSFSGLHETVYAIIKARILKQEPIPTVDQLASLFNVSSATLRRRLDEAGTSISKAKEACRADWARELLTSSSLSIEDIADKLRFSSAATFRRAFKQWTGYAPSAYRDSAIGIAKKMASGEAATTA